MKRTFVFALTLLMVILVLSLSLTTLAEIEGYVGEWVCAAVDTGGGVKQTEYNGIKAADLMRIKFNSDGTLLVTSLGEAIPGTWTETAEGISAVIDSLPVVFIREDNQLVNNSNGTLIYLEKAEEKPKTGGLLSLVKGSKYIGRWVGSAVDAGNGVMKTEMEGVKVSDLLAFLINRDGTLEMTSMGLVTSGVWQEIEGGIRVTVEGVVTDMMYLDDKLTADSDGMIIYFERSEQTEAAIPTDKPSSGEASIYIGTWTALRFETIGSAYDAKTLFPDGCTVTLLEDGTGKAFITSAYTENLTWSEKDSQLTLNGSYVFSKPVLDADKGELKLDYASNTVSVYFSKSGTEAIVPTAIPTSAQTAKPTAVLTAAPTNVPTAVPTKEPTAKNSDPGLCDTHLFTARFPAKGWAANETWKYDRADYCYVKYELKDASGTVTASVSLSASSDDVNTYRDKIASLLETAQESSREALDERVISGIKFAGIDYVSWGWKYIEYAARVPESRITLMITIDRPESIGDSLQAILDSISYKLPVLTPPNVDPPLPEDGTPYQPKSGSAVLGDIKISASWIKTDRSIILDSIFDNRITLSGDNLYVLAGNKLYAYIIDSSRLIPDVTPKNGVLKLDDEYEYLCTAKDGTIFVSQGMFNILAVKNGAIVREYDTSGNLVIHPEKAWGITYWSNADPKLVRISGDKMTEEPWVLSGLSDVTKRKGRFSSISCLTITDKRIYVAGSDSLSADAQRVAVFDMKGNEMFTFGSTNWTADDAFGSITGIVETQSGILVQDGNFRDFKLFSFDGAFLGKVPCDGLFGTNYPWLSSMISTESGVLVAASQARNDKSCDELLIFLITGL